MIRVATLVWPKSSPKIVATRSKLATATRPQFRPPTMSSAALTMSIFFIMSNSRLRFV
jgi:hypothetical protein